MFRRFRWLGLSFVVVVAALSVSTASIASTRHPATHSRSLGSRLVNRFFSEIERHDVAGLRKFLSPAFQIQRADGSRLTKRQYLHTLPTIISYKLRDLRTTSRGSVLVVTYQAAAKEVIDGKKFKSGYAPRLSVFSSSSAGWQIVAHANFNTPRS